MFPPRPDNEGAGRVKVSGTALGEAAVIPKVPALHRNGSISPEANGMSCDYTGYEKKELPEVNRLYLMEYASPVFLPDANY